MAADGASRSAAAGASPSSAAGRADRGTGLDGRRLRGAGAAAGPTTRVQRWVRAVLGRLVSWVSAMGAGATAPAPAAPGGHPVVAGRSGAAGSAGGRCGRHRAGAQPAGHRSEGCRGDGGDRRGEFRRRGAAVAWELPRLVPGRSVAWGCLAVDWLHRLAPGPTGHCAVPPRPGPVPGRGRAGRGGLGAGGLDDAQPALDAARPCPHRCLRRPGDPVPAEASRCRPATTPPG